MRMTQVDIMELKSLFSEWVCDKPREVFHSEFPPMSPDIESEVWLRHSVELEYPDDAVIFTRRGRLPAAKRTLQDLMAGGGCGSLRISVHPIALEVFKHITVDKDAEEYCEEHMHVLHISLGSFMIHLVPAGGQEECGCIRGLGGLHSS